MKENKGGGKVKEGNIFKQNFSGLETTGELETGNGNNWTSKKRKTRQRKEQTGNTEGTKRIRNKFN